MRAQTRDALTVVPGLRRYNSSRFTLSLGNAFHAEQPLRCHFRQKNASDRHGPASPRPEPIRFDGDLIICRPPLIAHGQTAVAGRDRAPPRAQRFMAAAQFDAHAVGEFDPVGEPVTRHRDHDRNVGT
jgi:hypothetical protein